MSNRWLYEQLERKPRLCVENTYQPLIRVQKQDKHFSIYTPTPHEYLITIAIVQKVQNIGGDTISYPGTWSRPTREATLYGEQNNVRIVTHRELFELLDSP